MLRSSFRKAFQARSREAVLLLVRMPLTEVNRPALAAAARRASVEALLAVQFPLVRLCHGISVLASETSGPGIPEGAARIRALRAALNAAEAEAGLAEGSGATASDTLGMSLSGCPCSRVVPVRGRLPLGSSLIRAAVASGTGLRILRFRPSGLKGTPQDLSDRLSDLLRREALLGLYAITGRRPDSPAREFALFVPDRPPEASGGRRGADPLAGFPVAGRIRTLVGAGAESPSDLAGFELTDGDAGTEQAGPARIGKAGGLDAPGRSAEARPAKPAAPVRRETREAEYRNAAVLRAEIPDLLGVLKGMDPREAAAYLNRVLARLASCVEATGGIVDSCAGGGIRAFWGAPTSTGRDAEAAGKAALAMRRTIGALNRGRLASGKVPLRLFCALDVGPVLAAPIGAPNRPAYTAAGEAPRRAAGMGHRNGRLGTDILVSEYAVRLLGTAFRFQPVDRLEAGGESGTVGIYALLGRSGDASGPRDLGDLRKRLGTV